MDRDRLISKLRRYARRRSLAFVVEKHRGKGSHYRVRVGSSTTTVQYELDTGRIERVLKQLGVDPADL